MIRSQRKLNEAAEPEEQHLSQSDKAVLNYQKLAAWFTDNTRTVIGGGVLLLALIIAFVYWRIESGQASDHAETLLSRIMPAYQENQWRDAIDGDMKTKIMNEPIFGLRKIADDYGSTNAGQLAMLCLGNSYYYLGKLDSALMAFDGISSDLPLIKASANAGKAAILADKGNKEDAAKLFMSAASVEAVNPMNADYSYSAARSYEQAGKKDEAIKVYRKIVEEYQGTYFDDGARRALIRLNAPL